MDQRSYPVSPGGLLTKILNMSKVTAPFNDEQVTALLAWQEGHNGGAHPFTCMGHDGCKRIEELNYGTLIPGTDGFTCPCGKYKQDWCYDFMLNFTAVDQQANYVLAQRAIAILHLAMQIGFNYDNVKSFMLQQRTCAEMLANTISTAIAWWLRKRHKMIVWVEPVYIGKNNFHSNYKSMIRFFGINSSDPAAVPNSSYELEFLAGIEYALNALTPGAQANSGEFTNHE